MTEIRKTDFVEALKTVVPFISTGTLAILGNVKINVCGDKAVFQTTDLTSFASAECAAIGSDDFVACTDAKRLQSVIMMVPGELVHIGMEDYKLTIEGGGYSCSIQTVEAGDFPAMHDESAVSVIKRLPEQLASIVAKGGCAHADDLSRQVLCGVSFRMFAGSLCVTSTDGHRLGRCSTPAGGDECDFVLPASAVARLSKAQGDDEMLIGVSVNYATFQFKKSMVSVKVEKDIYPDVDRVIPKNFRGEFVVGRDDLLSAVRRVAVLANEKTRLVALDIADGETGISVINRDIGGESSDTVKTDYSGDPIKIGVNAMLFTQILSLANADNVRIKFGNETSPVMIYPEPCIGEEYLLMPLRILGE